MCELIKKPDGWSVGNKFYLCFLNNAKLSIVVTVNNESYTFPNVIRGHDSQGTSTSAERRITVNIISPWERRAVSGSWSDTIDLLILDNNSTPTLDQGTPTSQETIFSIQLNCV